MFDRDLRVGRFWNRFQGNHIIINPTPQISPYTSNSVLYSKNPHYNYAVILFHPRPIIPKVKRPQVKQLLLNRVGIRVWSRSLGRPTGLPAAFMTVAETSLWLPTIFQVISAETFQRTLSIQHIEGVSTYTYDH